MPPTDYGAHAVRRARRQRARPPEKPTPHQHCTIWLTIAAETHQASLMLAAAAAARTAWLGLLLGARDVLARARVDADHFAFVDEQRHPHHRAGLELRRLLAAGGRIAAHARIGLGHLQLDVRRWRDHQRDVVPQGDDAHHTV